MAKDITLMGASYLGVPAVELPQTGGGIATFYDDVGYLSINENGTFDVKGFAEAIVNVSGAGGSSNIASGKFKGTTAGSVLNINLEYYGIGYPVGFIVQPVGGQGGNTSFSQLVQRYCCAQYIGCKFNSAIQPTYASSGEANQFVTFHRYKSSTSSATSYSSANAANTIITSGANAATGQTNILKFKDSKTLSVFIATNSYGFAANVEYEYYVVFSSESDLPNVTPFDWSLIGTTSYPLGWRNGYWNPNTGSGNSSSQNYIRSVQRYEFNNDVKYLIIYAPTNYSVRTLEYLSDETYTENYYGNADGTGNNPIIIPITPGNKYAFTMGYFSNGDSGTFITENFIKTIKGYLIK